MDYEKYDSAVDDAILNGLRNKLSSAAQSISDQLELLEDDE